MADINLIPAAYLKREIVGRQVKRLLIALVAVAGLVIAARVALSHAIVSETATVARLAKAEEIYSQTEAKADGYRQQREIGEKRLSYLDELRGRDRLKILLQALDTAYSPSIWLDDLRFLRRENLPTATLNPGGGNPATTVPVAPNVAGAAASRPSVEQRVEIVGHAVDHTQLAEFMRRLSAQPGIADVRLLDTGLRTYANTQVIDLSLTLLIDDKAGRPR